MWSEMSNIKEQDNLTVVTQPLPNDEPRDSQRALLVYIYMCVCVCVCVCVSISISIYLYIYIFLLLFEGVSLFELTPSL